MVKNDVNFTGNHTGIRDKASKSDDVIWIPFAEPVPDWEEASEKWGIWWYIHIYGVGSLFFVISIFTLANFIALCLAKNLPQKPYFITLNVIVFIFSTERGIFMFVDAYNIRGTLPPPVAYLFLSIGLPCMTSSFYLIFVAWMKATKMQRTNTVHKTKTMVIIIIVHFTVSLAFDLAAGYTIHAMYLLVCCQACFIVLGIILSIMYFYLYGRIYYTAVKSRKDLVKMSGKIQSTKSQKYEKTNSLMNGSKLPSVDEHCKYKYPNSNNYGDDFKRRSSIPEAKIPLGAKLILATAILLFIIACLVLIGIFACYTLQVISGQSPEAWSWWAYELALRICEIALCWTISLAATRPITRRLAKEVSIRVRNSKRKLVQSSVKSDKSTRDDIIKNNI